MLGSKGARATYIETLITNPQHLFIWELFHPGTILHPGNQSYYDQVIFIESSADDLSYQVPRQRQKGSFQSPPVLQAFSIYFTCHRIQSEVPSADPGEGLHLIGALTLTAAAVKHGYHMHLSGVYVTSGSEFSLSKWLSVTELYLEMIKNDLMSDDWTAIFQALHCLQDTNTQDNCVQVGAPLTPKQHELLLPADPPTLPPLD